MLQSSAAKANAYCIPTTFHKTEMCSTVCCGTVDTKQSYLDRLTRKAPYPTVRVLRERSPLRTLGAQEGVNNESVIQALILEQPFYVCERKGKNQSVKRWQAFFQRHAVHHRSFFSIPYTLRHFFASPRGFLFNKYYSRN